MDPIVALPKWLRRILRAYAERKGLRSPFDTSRVDTVWIDVGAHLGEGTLSAALESPNLLVFAFEPNWALARQLMGRAANFVVLPIAMSDKDGYADFFINTYDESSSLARMVPSGLSHWGDFDLAVAAKVVVPTMRVDTFMGLAGLHEVDYLKVDAEGTDLKVVRSAGNRLRDIRKVTLEVDVAPERLYEGAPSSGDVMAFMSEHGFRLAASESQNAGRQTNLTFECSLVGVTVHK